MKMLIVALIAAALFAGAGGCALFCTNTYAEAADSAWSSLHGLYMKRAARVEALAKEAKDERLAKAAAGAWAAMHKEQLGKKDLDELTLEEVRGVDAGQKALLALAGPLWSSNRDTAVLDAEITVAREAVGLRARKYNDKITSGGPYEWTAKARGRKLYLVIPRE